VIFFVSVLPLRLVCSRYAIVIPGRFNYDAVASFLGGSDKEAASKDPYYSSLPHFALPPSTVLLESVCMTRAGFSGLRLFILESLLRAKVSPPFTSPFGPVLKSGISPSLYALHI